MTHIKVPKCCFLLLSLLMIIFCGKEPTEPLRDNPFDPVNPSTGGDPFQLQAQIANGGITLTWNKPTIPGLASFRVYRSEQENTGYSVITTVSQNTTQYVDQTALNGHIYWYRVSAVNTTNAETSMTNTAAINIKTDPFLVINGGAQYTSMRSVNLTILAHIAQQMIISNTLDFQNAQWETYSTSKPWTLPTGEGQKIVYLKVKYDTGNESATVSDSILPQPMNPSIMINNGDTYTSSRNVTLQLSAEGATQMYISDTSLSGNEISMLYNKKESIKVDAKENKKIIKSKSFSEEESVVNNNVVEDKNSYQGWEDFSTTKSWILSSGEGQKTVYAKFKNDFEIESNVVSDVILPQPINPGITIAGGAQYTPSRDVQLILSATGNNLSMKVSEDSTFTSINWQSYQSPINFTLTTGEGQKTVYANFKNDFEIESGMVNCIITLDTSAPIPVLTVLPDSGITNETNFQFNPNSSYDNFCPLNEMQIRFDWENNGSWDTGWSNLQITGHQYTVGGGDKTARMGLRDGAGWTSDTTATLYVNTRPVALFTATQDAGDPRLLHFDASASSDYEDGTNLQYRWDWENDGTWDTGFIAVNTISYQYVNYGQYIAKLEVRDTRNLTSAIINTVSTIPICIDVDGNDYKIVKIGNQWWMAENLKVTKYRDNTPIPLVTDNAQWVDLSTSIGAYCDYDNNPNNATIYGHLYNWYATDEHIHHPIAPVGWHVPTSADLDTLVNFLGGSSIAGAAMKDTTLWNSPYWNATNSSGFTALPGGFRFDINGEFRSIGNEAYFW